MIPDGWNVYKINELSHYITSGSRGWAQYYSDSGDLFVRITNLTRERLSLDLSDSKYVRIPENSNEGKRTRLMVGDILISITADLGIIGFVENEFDKPAYINQHVALLRIDEKEIDNRFIAYQMASESGHQQFISLNDAGAKSGLNLDSIRRFSILIPPILEQCRIAEMLGVWDESIDLLERLIGRVRSRKQGLMQQLLTGKKRFKEFEDSEWKRYHFKDIFKRITRKNTVNNSNILTISGTHGLINQRDFFNKRVAADNLEGYYLIEKGEFAYNKSYSSGYPLGAIKRLDRYGAGVLSTLYICFGLSNSLNSGDFMAHYFEPEIFNKEIYGIAQEGARNHGLLNIGVNDFFELFLRIPSLPEQEKIAAVLSAADEEISTLEKQLAAYKQQKLGLMQQLLTGSIRI
jgi:type I restriction enzyme, S subunit